MGAQNSTQKLIVNYKQQHKAANLGTVNRYNTKIFQLITDNSFDIINNYYPIHQEWFEN